MSFSTIRIDSQKKYASLEDLKRDVLFSEKMIKYGEYVVVIPQSELFLERLEKAALKDGFVFFKGPVNYYDFSKDNVWMSSPKKRSEKEASSRIKESFASCCEKRTLLMCM